MRKNIGWIVLSLLLTLVGLASLGLAVLTPMMFDAPGSEFNSLVIALVIAILALPISCFLGALLPWLFRRWRFAKSLFLLPAVNIAAISLLFFAIDHFCGGQFSCAFGSG